MIYDEDIREVGDERKARKAERTLAALAFAIALAILIGTLVGLATGSRQRKLARESRQEAAASSGLAAFDTIGTVRAKSSDSKSAVVVATIAFPYDPADRAFAEELERKAPSLKAAAIACLSRKKAADLAPAYEGAVKAALRDEFNRLLSLGKVGEIWLSDFAVIQ
jgi:flagellar basal body-associated protein FliL